jgi:hypothetical protein
MTSNDRALHFHTDIDCGFCCFFWSCVYFDWQAMQRVAMGIRQLKPPEAYTGKGVVFWNETVRRKEGKKK